MAGYVSVIKPQTLTIDMVNKLRQLRTPHVGRYTVPAATAAYILETYNKRNRKFKRTFRILIKALKAGRWHFNGQPIAFDDQGWFRDGQNRLRASRDSGLPIDTMVMFGLAETAFRATDRGEKRNNVDHVVMQGEHDDLPANILSSAVSCWYRYMEGKWTERGIAPDADDFELIVKQHPGLVESVRHVVETAPKRFRIPLGVVAFFDYLFGRIDKVKGRAFIDALLSGDRGGAKVPVAQFPPIILRNKVITDGKITGITLNALIIKAWNRYYKDITLKSSNALRWVRNGTGREDFPKVEGAERVFVTSKKTS